MYSWHRYHCDSSSGSSPEIWYGDLEASRVKISMPCGAIPTPNLRFCPHPGLLELYIHGRISDLKMGPYRPRVRRDLDVVPRGN